MKSIRRGHEAWEGKDGPTQEDIRKLLRKTNQETTIVTCPRRAAAQVNDMVLNELFYRPGQKLLGEIPGHFDANEENYDAKGQLRTDRKPIPKFIKIFKGMRLFLTNNLKKKDDFVNGMEATVEDYIQKKECLIVRTRTDKRLAVWLYTDPDPDHQRATYFPIRIGYASTIHKVQGATLKHVTIWLDIPGMKGAGHVALSRVQHDEDYLIAGGVGPEHFQPAM